MVFTGGLAAGLVEGLAADLAGALAGALGDVFAGVGLGAGACTFAAGLAGAGRAFATVLAVSVFALAAGFFGAALEAVVLLN